MKERHTPGLLERSLTPWPLLLGIVTSFLACCIGGRILSRQNGFERFERFHFKMNPLSLYYPTTSQVQALAREKLDPDRVAVIVGGNSVLYGGGNGLEKIWAQHLQAELGEGYRVLNLALPGGRPFEFGATAAEFLVRDYPKLILVTNTWFDPGQHAGDPDGQPHVRYFFEEARARGLLLSCPEREVRLHELEHQREVSSSTELKAQMCLDGPLYFRDLWNEFTYQYLTTAWCAPLADTWWRPRRDWPDPDWAASPVDEATLRSLGANRVPELRERIVENQPHVRPAAGQALLPSPLERSVKECLPFPLRERTLVVINHSCPYFRQQLTPTEQELYGELAPATVRALEKTGVSALDLGPSLSTRHYCDSVHLTAEGGRRMAAAVAPKVRALARRLGYLTEGSHDPEGK